MLSIEHRVTKWPLNLKASPFEYKEHQRTNHKMEESENTTKPDKETKQ